MSNWNINYKIKYLIKTILNENSNFANNHLCSEVSVLVSVYLWSSSSSAKVRIWGLILFDGMMLTFLFSIEAVYPTSTLIICSFLTMVFSKELVYSLNFSMYSKFGVSFPFKVITALFNSGIKVCSYKGNLASLLTTPGTQFFKRQLNYIAKINSIFTCIISKLTW